MIEFETILILMAIGIISLIITLFLLFTGKKIEPKKEIEQEIFIVKIFNYKIKLVPFLYLKMVLIMFLIGIFSDFLIDSIIGLTFALIPFVAYLIFNTKKDELTGE